jgi:hypothetical protein
VVELLSAPALTGATKIEIDGVAAGFAVGDEAMLVDSQAPGIRERVRLRGFGSMLLDEPLKHSVRRCICWSSVEHPSSIR